MVRDLDMPLEIEGCPTIREDDGLAVSSRNNYLSASERRQAICLYQALCQARELIQTGEHDPKTVVRDMQNVIDAAGPAVVDYISLVEPESMQPVETITGPVLIALAVRIGPARLIDNMLVDPADRSA
jgi:pantoate--beta-alanine ligase